LDYSCDSDSLGAVTDVRPLVVLDLHDFYDGAVDFVATLRALNSETADWLADQIEEQVKPARIDEPGLYGVVSTEDPEGLVTYRWHSHGGWHGEDGSIHEWDDLIDPTLVREGLS
jgi:hypothetical protein